MLDKPDQVCQDVAMSDYVVHVMLTADELTDGDNIYILNDYLENVVLVRDGDAIMVKGYSEITGDNAVYILSWDAEVGLWTAE